MARAGGLTTPDTFKSPTCQRSEWDRCPGPPHLPDHSRTLPTIDASHPNIIGQTGGNPGFQGSLPRLHE